MSSSRTPSPSLSASRENIPEAANSETNRRSSILSRLLFRNSEKRGSQESMRTVSPVNGERCASPSRTTSPSRRLANFASRSVRKNQWRLFKHHTFFGSQRSSIKAGKLQLPRLTLRHPSVDGTAMPLPLDADDRDERDIVAVRSQSRRWTDTETGRLRGSRESSGFHDSHDAFDGAEEVPQAMTAPVSPSVPLSASSSHSDGWKYSSQKLLWKLKPRYINFSHASSTSSSTDSAWKSLDSTTWRSVDGAEVVLRGARLETLSEIERSALQVLAAQRLGRLLPGVSVGKPKDPLAALRQKRQKLVKSTRTLTVTEAIRRPSSSSTSDDKRVFGVSLAKCMQNEKRLDQESRCRSLDDSSVCLLPRGKPVAKSVKSEPEMVQTSTVTSSDERKWLYPSTQNLYPSCSSHQTSSSLVGSAPPTCSLLPNIPSVSAQNLAASEQVSESIVGRFAKKQRPSSASFSSSFEGLGDVDPHSLQVPRIVENCTQYLMAYGLNTVGLFRVAGNTKRCRQLRDALEKGGGGTAISDDVVENTTAHDVATLLKEYFRDLPQSLLPREHYQAYIACSKLGPEDHIEAIRLLVGLLCSPNVDTLYVLLKFLHEVMLNSNDRTAADGTMIKGNKMDARNLATIFAPSILRADHEKLHATLAENEQQIAVVETMITCVEEIFVIPRELQSKMYNKLRETEPDRLDRILNLLSRADGAEHGSMLSPFPATLEEELPRSALQQNSPISCKKSPLARESQSSVRGKLTSQRSGSWPFSLTRPTGSPKANVVHFFPSTDDETFSSSTPSTSRRPQTLSSATTETTSTPLDDSEVRRAEGSAQQLVKPATPRQTEARSPSRERVDNLRTAARSSAAAARRRLRNVVRAFRFTSITRSNPDIAQPQA
ncbi:unnamed protein product [Caenorhabditis auriculariae]|uniref:Rho-GAP domain-containing protein n=1 Tax=Caenorhabditis auriculariae TaxID=2777116 RepID=A0A8S1GNZ6_9PELO|nr:unnamed protein product [Caenorhabditis auriculariae]